jgi:hypothetical protein
MPVPLRERKVDLLFLIFFVINLGLVTYIIDLEQLVIADPSHFTYPVWPPAPMVDLVHSYGHSLDPLLLARPPFWRMTIWIDVLFFGPFYAFGIYAFIRGRSWIRVPALVWSGMMLSNVLIILMDERYGTSATPHFGLVLLLNVPWLAFPIGMIARMRRDRPFERTAPAAVMTEAEAAA